MDVSETDAVPQDTPDDEAAPDAPPLRARLGRQGRRYVTAAHDVRHTAAATTALYGELLGTPAVREPAAARPGHGERVAR